MKGVSHVHFDTADLPPEKRFATWAAALPHYDLALPPGLPVEGFSCKATVWYLGDIIMTRALLPDMGWRRVPAKIHADGVDTYNFLFLNSGIYTGTADDRGFTIGTGQLGCFDLARPSAGTSSASNSLAITFSRLSIDRLVRVAPDMHGRVFSSPAGTLLVDYLMAVERHLPSLDHNDVPAIARAILAQFAATIEVTTRSGFPSNTAVVQHKARQHIERHLVDRALNPATLADALGIARAALYRSFKPFGGISAYIQRRRLEAVRVLLSDPYETRSIGGLAEEMGFASASHLSAAFRRAYGMTPRDMRDAAGSISRTDVDECGPAEQFRRWTSRLQGRTI